MTDNTPHETIKNATIRIRWADTGKPFDALRESAEAAGAHWRKESLVSIPSGSEATRIDIMLEAPGGDALNAARREMEKLTQVESFTMGTQAADNAIHGRKAFREKPRGGRRY